jgi:YD repeat-containing protein
MRVTLHWQKHSRIRAIADHLSGIDDYDVSNRAVDVNGNTTSFQANGWTYGLSYNDANRLSVVQQNGKTTEQYGINGLGKRVANKGVRDNFWGQFLRQRSHPRPQCSIRRRRRTSGQGTG